MVITGAKKAPSSFLFFANERRKQLLLLNPALTFQEIAHKLGNEWKQLTPSKKKIFEQLSAAAQQVYRHNINEYVIARDKFYDALVTNKETVTTDSA